MSIFDYSNWDPPQLGAASAGVLEAIQRETPRVLILPESWPILDAVTGKRERSRDAVHRLLRFGWLEQIRRGAYAVRSDKGIFRISALELIGALTRGQHLVTAGYALTQHRLSDQSFRRIVVVVPNAQRNWSWMGMRIRYVRMKSDQIWGSRNRSFENDLASTLASPERAILDSLAHPGWGVTITQVTEGLDRAIRNDDTFVEHLAQATARYGNAMLARRLGFLIERLYDANMARPFLSLRGSTHASANLLSALPAGADSTLNSRWGVQENIPFELLIDHRRIG